jgi:hypothetical protein
VLKTCWCPALAGKTGLPLYHNRELPFSGQEKAHNRLLLQTLEMTITTACVVAVIL